MSRVYGIRPTTFFAVDEQLRSGNGDQHAI